MTDQKEHNRERAEAMVLQTVATLSTLLTALEVRYRASERRAGRDPSGQEPAPEAHAYVLDAADELERLLTQLARSTMYAGNYEEDYLAAAVRRFDDLMRLNRAAVLLHGIHQRLMSLYPAVSEDLLEAVRLLDGKCREMDDPEEEAFTGRLAQLVDEGLALAVLIRSDLSA